MGRFRRETGGLVEDEVKGAELKIKKAQASRNGARMRYGG